ncbi:MAG: hypothetical protein UZ19_OD1001009 [Parcubacteria bacterium OLB19]|nr:MAG: hypothetical protein UZ19_OD1001009 [Parcubacteria bacterium OLB19]
MKFINTPDPTKDVIKSILNDTNNFHILIYTFNRPSISFFIQLLKLEEIVSSTKQIEAYTLWDLVTVANANFEIINNLVIREQLLLSESRKIKVLNLATEGSNIIHTKLNTHQRRKYLFCTPIKTTPAYKLLVYGGL